MKAEKGMILFYDWVAPLEDLKGEEFKALILAMLEYHKNGTPPPEFEGHTLIASQFIFPQIKRMRESIEAKANKRRY